MLRLFIFKQLIRHNMFNITYHLHHACCNNEDRFWVIWKTWNAGMPECRNPRNPGILGIKLKKLIKLN